MWEESSSGFGDESPILFKSAKRLRHVPDCPVSLEEIHKKLLLHLRKSQTMSQSELRSFLKQTKGMDPPDCKGKWLLAKIRDLLNYSLKKRDFPKSVLSESFTEAPKFSKGAGDVSFQMPPSLLSNNDFMTPEKCNVKMEVDFSQDLFSCSDNFESLHGFSQENYNIFKRVIEEEKVFKLPSVVSKIEDVLQVHDYCSSLLTQTITDSGQALEAQMEDMGEDGANIFDNLTISNEELTEDLEAELEKTTTWVSEIIHNLKNLRVDEISNEENAQVLNESSSSALSSKITPYYSEENFKIVREACCTFKETLENRPNKAILKELLNNL
ncbi:hypothetical protein TcasGA2_TC011940 [Tribolium castaneum]|uniref:Uncharacterized protein n=1 Tax=Tribolium castaneum TaxID=7070 RepID=D6X358_TRICA|nr:hypothetical protein TcasGA2_TC011940 [Tribolium castaneum]